MNGKRKDISATFNTLSNTKKKTALPYFFSRQAATSLLLSLKVQCHQRQTNKMNRIIGIMIMKASTPSNTELVIICYKNS